MAYALSARGIVLMLLCIAAATSSLGIEQASLLASQTLRVLEWGPGRDLVEIFDKGEPVLLTGSPVRDWPLLSLGEDELHDAIAELQMDSAVFAVQSTTTSPSSPDVGKPAVVVNTAKNLPDNREVIFEPDTRAFELRDTNGAALLASGERNNEEIYKTAGRGGTVQEGISWRSQNLLTETPESKLLWDFFLQGENQFDMRWLFYRLEHGPFDGRPSISFKAMPVGASTPLRQDARHEAIVQLTGINVLVAHCRSGLRTEPVCLNGPCFVCCYWKDLPNVCSSTLQIPFDMRSSTPHAIFTMPAPSFTSRSSPRLNAWQFLDRTILACFGNLLGLRIVPSTPVFQETSGALLCIPATFLWFHRLGLCSV